MRWCGGSGSKGKLRILEPPHFVIAGLDPAIHADEQHENFLGRALTERLSERHFRMDHRVKPGGDEGTVAATLRIRSSS
jgi:hypothetical protein